MWAKHLCLYFLSVLFFVFKREPLNFQEQQRVRWFEQLERGLVNTREQQPEGNQLTFLIILLKSLKAIILKWARTHVKVRQHIKSALFTPFCGWAKSSIELLLQLSKNTSRSYLKRFQRLKSTKHSKTSIFKLFFFLNLGTLAVQKSSQ